MDPVTDPDEHARLTRAVHDAVLGGAPAPVAPRSVVSESWQRSLAASVDPEQESPPVVFSSDEVADVRSTHPLAEVVPLLRDALVSIADEARHVMIVTDADGNILWREGSTAVRVLADRVRLTEGTAWSEQAVGTNAMGTSLALDRPVRIHSAEHLVRAYHDWTCAAAPVHDPDTGLLLGAIDVTGPVSTRHPATLALVTAVAQLAENQLRARMHARDERLRIENMAHLRGVTGALVGPTGRVLANESGGPLPERVAVAPGPLWLPDGREAELSPLAAGYLLRVRDGSAPAPRQARLRLSFLGRDQPLATLDGRDLVLGMRHAEILAVLALHEHGVSAERLASALYGESGNPVTARAEIHRLRTQLGESVVRTRPYRLCADVDADFLRVTESLRRGAVAEALTTWTGPLLPRSDAPAIREEREDQFAVLRRAAMNTPGPEALWTLSERLPAPDAEILQTLTERLPRADLRHPTAVTRLHRALHH
jgi:hypothetical protein